ncbi:helix-turn-helix domain-containing protein [Cupriavidus sp. WKF15]|uniref:helix-turn-helix domain-containing protein n=1 Tax=Cupriavidus sp. WKF15 TaxID=3032282 RepID=UPI0023E2FA21|nr:helix-turn-helix domain-containing protein [Cupriavidus sp. WKF15]WER50710.1 helix-turn-helix domain-containing protein [Cupriavidus sp. WKF15]
MPIDQAARHCGVSVGMLSKLENGKGVNLEHVLRVLDGLGLTMLVVPKAHGSWLEQAAPHAAKVGDRSIRLAHSCSNRNKADFPLRGGRFHSGLAIRARAFLSTG